MGFHEVVHINAGGHKKAARHQNPLLGDCQPIGEFRNYDSRRDGTDCGVCEIVQNGFVETHSLAGRNEAVSDQANHCQQYGEPCQLSAAGGNVDGRSHRMLIFGTGRALFVRKLLEQLLQLLDCLWIAFRDVIGVLLTGNVVGDTHSNVLVTESCKETVRKMFQIINKSSTKKKPQSAYTKKRRFFESYMQLVQNRNHEYKNMYVLLNVWHNICAMTYSWMLHTTFRRESHYGLNRSWNFSVRHTMRHTEKVKAKFRWIENC